MSSNISSFQGGGTDLKRGYEDVRPWRSPLFTPLLPIARVPFQANESVHKTPFWENLEILASAASIFTQILAHKPPNLEIFSSQAPKFGNFQLTSPQIWKFSAHKPPNFEFSAHKPPFSDANVSSQAPHFGNPGRTPLPEKKLSAPRVIIQNLCTINMTINVSEVIVWHCMADSTHPHRTHSHPGTFMNPHTGGGGGYSHIKTYRDVPQKSFGFLFLFLFCFVLLFQVIPSR